MLSQISRRIPTGFLKIAPIGTKPHALGAILYYLDFSSATEIIYDHPIRRKGGPLARPGCAYTIFRYSVRSNHIRGHCDGFVSGKGQASAFTV